jgi:Mg-chelatase subunit ChlD
VKEGAAADEAVAESARRTASRRELARHEGFEQVSPEVGQLDEEAFRQLMDEDPDRALALLADLTSATDPRLRELARRLAGRIMVDVSRRGRARQRGIGKMVTQPYRPDGGDLDLDASLEAVAEARAAGGWPDAEGLRVRGWRKPATALCLIVDRSGSMGGAPLATSALAAAAVAQRAPEDYSVLAFGPDVVVAKAQDHPKPAGRVVTDVLALRGFGTTDLAGALRAAGAQLQRSPAARRIAVLLSDCRATVPGDVVSVAKGLDELCILAPAADADEARALADSVGARLATVEGPSQIADALAAVLEEQREAPA